MLPRRLHEPVYFDVPMQDVNYAICHPLAEQGSARIYWPKKYLVDLNNATTDISPLPYLPALRQPWMDLCLSLLSIVQFAFV